MLFWLFFYVLVLNFYFYINLYYIFKEKNEDILSVKVNNLFIYKFLILIVINLRFIDSWIIYIYMIRIFYLLFLNESILVFYIW